MYERDNDAHLELLEKIGVEERKLRAELALATAVVAKVDTLERTDPGSDNASH